jgi:hypothetical protein
MEQNAGLTIALILVALAVLMQAGTMIGIWLAVRKIPAQIEAVRAEVKQGLNPLAQSVTEIVNNAREPLRTISLNLADISKMLRGRTADLDALVAEVVDKSREQVIRVDQMVSDLVQKVETTSDAMQRGVLVPMQEVSAVIAGMRAGLEFLFTRRRTTSVSEAAQDEQLFI